MAASAALAPAYERISQERCLRRRCRERRALALTYDDGPGARLTPQLLDLLATRQAGASFFVVGERARSAPELLDRMVAEGHQVGCHTFSHLHPWRTTPGRAVRDVERGYAALSRWVAADGCFRPPHGKLTPATWLSVRRRGASLGFWTLDSGDTHDRLPDPAGIADAAALTSGGVVLMHDFDRSPPEPEREAFVLQLTERLLDLAAGEGLHVRTLAELLA